MANISFHADRGAIDTVGVTFGTGASTLDIELIIDNAVGVTKKDVLLTLAAFKKAVQESELFAEI